jgi:dephospho-CoA kinase
VFLVGLTGGIGSGKSTVAALLAGRGAIVIDADAVAREVVQPGTEGLDAIVERFGPSVVTGDGTLDRPALAALVFADRDARSALNAIVHPRVAARIAELLEQAAGASGPEQLVVIDVPLLVESNVDRGYHAVVVVTAPEAVRIERLVARGMDAEDARARIAAQASDEERSARATHVVDNSGDLPDLAARVSDLHSELAAAARATAT